MYNILNPASNTYYVACHPLKDVYHVGGMSSENQMTTGQPLLLIGTDCSQVINSIYSSYPEDKISALTDIDFAPTIETDENGDIIEDPPVLREITWSVGYTLEESEQTITIVNQLLPNLYLQAIKHPDREEYSLPYSDYIISNASDGALKEAIVAKHSETISEGNSKSKEEMIAGGWINE